VTGALVVKSGPFAGRRYDIDAEVVLGREDAALTIDDPEISRRHALLRPSGGGLEIEDAGSRNGTYVNGIAVSGTTRLSSGDEITVKASRGKVASRTLLPMVLSVGVVAATAVTLVVYFAEHH
jgi:pSer/pThr/pTyr-binding forkhead associated (FHA) protein